MQAHSGGCSVLLKSCDTVWFVFYLGNLLLNIQEESITLLKYVENHDVTSVRTGKHF